MVVDTRYSNSVIAICATHLKPSQPRLGAWRALPSVSSLSRHLQLPLFLKLGRASRWALFEAEDGLVRRASLIRALAEQRYADLVPQIQLVKPHAWLLLEAVLELRDHWLRVHLGEDRAERAHLVRRRRGLRHRLRA